MYAVIFKAEVNEFDQQYFDMVETLRALAKDQYGCIDIISATEGYVSVVSLLESAIIRLFFVKGSYVV
jgi:hypothetical protein